MTSCCWLNTLPRRVLPFEGLIWREAATTEQQARAQTVLQVWILTSTNGALHAGVLLIYCDRQVMKSAVRNEGSVTQRSIKLREKKKKKLLSYASPAADV